MTLIQERVELAREGKNDKVICRLRSGWVVIGDVQPLWGYCLLLSDPVVASINDLPMDERAEFLKEMTIVGDAVQKVTGAKRMNYEILGNSEPELHAHIFPRYDDEPEELRRIPPFFYDWKSAAPYSQSAHGELKSAIEDALKEYANQTGGAAGASALLVRQSMKTLSSITDRPKLLADPVARTQRACGLRDPHMKPLSDFVASLRHAVGEGASIPDFDPWDGGVDAEVLFLLEAPGRKAVDSGFISRNNPDETAKNFFELSSDAGIARRRSVVWNIVPWYIGSGSKIRPARTIDVTSGSSSMASLLDLLPHLKVVVLLGRKAEYAERIIRPLRPQIRILNSPHPSPLFVNNAPGNRERVLNVFHEAARILDNEVA